MMTKNDQYHVSLQFHNYDIVMTNEKTEKS